MGHADPIFFIAYVCQQFGWTYQQYIEQPQFLLDAIAIKMRVEARIDKEQRMRAESRLK